MAAASHFSTRIYGLIEGNPPYTDGSGATSFSKSVDFNYAPMVSFPTGSTTFVPLPNGVVIGGAYIYSVIRVAPSGLNVHGQQYVTDTAAATLATNAG